MTYDDHNRAGAAPARARSEDAPHFVPPPLIESAVSRPQDLPGVPPPPQFHAGVPEDLRVPWGWSDVAMFVIFGLIARGAITRGLAQVAISFFGANANDMFGNSMSTAK